MPETTPAQCAGFLYIYIQIIFSNIDKYVDFVACDIVLSCVFDVLYEDEQKSSSSTQQRLALYEHATRDALLTQI